MSAYSLGDFEDARELIKEALSFYADELMTYLERGDYTDADRHGVETKIDNCTELRGDLNS